MDIEEIKENEETRIQRFKNRFKENKNTYIGTTIGFVTGAIVIIVIGNVRNANVRRYNKEEFTSYLDEMHLIVHGKNRFDE